MDTLVEQLDAKFRVWQPDMADQVRQRIWEIIEMADRDALDVLRSRTIAEVLDALDESATLERGSPSEPTNVPTLFEPRAVIERTVFSAFSVCPVK
jgi:hypothetical protein